ncbi:hypothetical protein GXP67_23260 [Rhodocytophaga rosea]|uniref:Uncharacterized protein n=1 Tax=Rhodocytophaga rosea TaxID=2704465 RepID=A0A6C0GMT2_9BACT|nr:hypothetical protein [Rhodocytophaga rosea]QHT69348.1 hypothetical protein GXP67_23260 [Rhodocytophaga rosea]
MSKKANILHIISLFLVVLTLIGTVAAKSSLLQKAGNKTVSVKKTHKQEPEQQHTVIIQAVSFEAIVSFVHFNLSQEFYFDFTQTFSRLLLFKHFSVEQPLFLLSYFTNTFCHHIAINAP